VSRWDKIKETVGSNGKQDVADRLPLNKKSSSKTNFSEETRDEFGQPPYVGTMTLPSMNAAAKRALNALVQQGTQDSGEIVIPNNLQGQRLPPTPRILPQTELKTDHLLIKSIQITKDMKTGNWLFGEIETNQGVFALGSEQNARLNQKMLKDLALYLKDIFESDLRQHLDKDHITYD
jgi:hypothetical protein